MPRFRISQTVVSKIFDIDFSEPCACVQVSALKAQCKHLVKECDTLAEQLRRRLAAEAEAPPAAAAAEAVATGHLWQDTLRLTERVAETSAANSEILSENSALTKQLEVRLCTSE